MQGNFSQKKVRQHTCTNWERQHPILTQALEVVSGREICLNISTVPRNVPFNINMPMEII